MKSARIDITTITQQQQFYNTYPRWATVAAQVCNIAAESNYCVHFRQTSIYGIFYIFDISTGITITRKFRTNTLQEQL